MENIHSDVSMLKINSTENILFAIIIPTNCNYCI